MRNPGLLFVLLTISIVGYSQQLIIEVAENHFNIDETHLMVVSHIEDINTYNDISTYTEVSIALSRDTFYFVALPDSLSYHNAYQIKGATGNYSLYFTTLPIVSITANETIVDEPKVLAHFTYADDVQVMTSRVGIEIRGGFSQTFPKKTYDLEFWEDDHGEESLDVQFGDMRSDDDWILDALYNEPLRLRSFVANKLWLDLHKLYYQEEESKAKSGADVMYVELFINGKYNGIYNLQEQVDRKQLKLKKYNGQIRGELYKGESWGATTFSNLPTADNQQREWGGYEMKYPQEEDATSWSALYDFTDFVINASDQVFKDDIWSLFTYDNYLDYFIFLNLLRATDNTGKNIYLAKYKAGEPYYYVPWDLDGCFGSIWDGTYENVTNDILTNGLIDRINNLKPNNYVKDLVGRWHELRDGILDDRNLLDRFSCHFNFLNDQKIYERESIVYPNYSFSEADFSYLETWVEDRLDFLDQYFDTLVSSFDRQPEISPKIILYPNPGNNRVYIKSQNQLNGDKYQIFDMLGRLVDIGTVHKNNIVIKNLTPGNYFIKISSKTLRLVVKP